MRWGREGRAVPGISSQEYFQVRKHHKFPGDEIKGGAVAAGRNNGRSGLRSSIGQNEYSNNKTVKSVRPPTNTI